MDEMATLSGSPSISPVEEAYMPTENPILSDEECLKERKWWCFLLSSIFTFLMGVLSVVVVRGIISICCHKEEDEFSQAELRRQEEEAKKLRLQVWKRPLFLTHLFFPYQKYFFWVFIVRILLCIFIVRIFLFEFFFFMNSFWMKSTWELIVS